MKLIKKLTSLAVLVGLTFTASAQQYSSTTIWGAEATNLAPSTAWLLALTDGFIPVTDYDHFAITVSCTWSNPAACWNGEGENLAALQAVFYPATEASATCVVTNYPLPLIVQCNTNLVYSRPLYGTNFNSFEWGYLKLSYISNGLSVAHATNIQVGLVIKPRLRSYR